MKTNKKSLLKKLLKNKFFKNSILSLLAGFAAFLMISTVSHITFWIFYVMKHSGLISEKYFYAAWVFDYALVCTIVGTLLAIVTVFRPMAKMTKLIEAMTKIKNGDFSVRLSAKKSGRITKKTVAIFNNMAQQLESTEMLSHDFINNFSHEFKTPIASINGFAKLLKNDDLTPQEREEYLDIIIQESERLSNLSINILTLSRLEQQSILTNKTSYDVSEQIRIVIGTLYHKWADKKIEIIFEGEDILIEANREMLWQVWINLIDNAIKFSPENHQIIIEAKKTEADLIIKIKNSGKQLSEEHLHRIFDKFYQGDKSHSTNGNGLGLPMVKRIIELHEGTITAKNTDEGFVVFTVTLPLESE